MKILIITSVFLPQIGGAELAVHNLAEGLNAQGHKVLLCTWMKKGKIVYSHNYKLLRYRRPKWIVRLKLGGLWWIQCLFWTILLWRPDVIHVNFLWRGGVWVAEILKRIKILTRIKIPLIFTAQGEDIQRYPSIPYGYRLDIKKKEKIDAAIRYADCLISIGEDVRKEYLEIGIKPKRIKDIPNSINYDILSRPSEKARQQLNIPDDVPVILAVGRNHPKKGFPDLINSLAILKKKMPGAIGMIVGSESSKLQPLVDKFGLKQNVILYETALPVGLKLERNHTPPEKQMETFFKAADIFAMPSIVESFGIVTVEAQAAGLPVVAMHSPGTVDLVKNGFNGYLITKGDHREFANSMYELLSNSEERKVMGKNACETTFKYDRNKIAKKHVEIYESLIAEFL